MDLVVGLGNPGGEYEHTRHNVGFDVLDELAREHNVSFQPGSGEFWFVRIDRGDVSAVLIKPTTFMNNSGVAVVQACERFDTPPGDSLIVFDDLHLPLGALRFRPRGSDGGHNGMASILYQTGTEDIPRLRCGIGPANLPDDIRSRSTFVLSVFARDEHSQAREMVRRAAKGVGMYLDKGIASAMNTFNHQPS